MKNLDRMTALFNLLPDASQVRVMNQISKALTEELDKIVGVAGLRVVSKKKETPKLEEPKNVTPKKPRKKPGKKDTPWVVHGRTFKSLQKMSEFYDIPIHKIQYERKKGKDLEEILPNKPSTLIKRTDDNGNQKYVVN